ncbi:metal-dependent transcriptional regulator [Compostimonas suwonensis]|uniref:Manganese transport regulator n=1 Tax=Compostimonas suwonensis TaxID=1048394 RepID=A0A2M9C4K1_9MICO|nr:metal-dependent transcriptional regulator [Compostimonas suwonensis]PJJ65453.1 DtxR family Mn-dependent transcriptional regulator [Compostimonas suwonensis]
MTSSTPQKSPAPSSRGERRTPAGETATEDYLKSIYAHTEWQPAAVTPSELAAKLGVAPSSVTEMVKKLAAQGLVTHVPYGAITLTDAGTARALGVIRRHRLVETWLVEEMGYSWDVVHDEAEVLEHAVSERLLDAMSARLGNPLRDPHGDPIPTADGHVVRTPAVLVSQAAPGHRGTVLRISDRDPAVLRLLDGLGIGVDTDLVVEGLLADAADAAGVADAATSARSVVVTLDDSSHHTLPAVTADAMWMTA